MVSCKVLSVRGLKIAGVKFKKMLAIKRDLNLFQWSFGFVTYIAVRWPSSVSKASVFIFT